MNEERRTTTDGAGAAEGGREDERAGAASGWSATTPLLCTCSACFHYILKTSVKESRRVALRIV